MPTIAYQREPDAMIAVMSRDTPNDDEWTAYTGAIQRGIAAGLPNRALVVTDGGAPTPAQRAKLERLTGSGAQAIKVAIVTASTFARGVVNAFALINPGYRAFSPDRLEDALSHIDVAPFRREEIRVLVARLRNKIT